MAYLKFIGLVGDEHITQVVREKDGRTVTVGEVARRSKTEVHFIPSNTYAYDKADILSLAAFMCHPEQYHAAEIHGTPQVSIKFEDPAEVPELISA